MPDTWSDPRVWVALEKLTPYLVPAELAASPHFDLLYHQDRVWIFALEDDACS